jgi:hypothetical protein
MTQLATVHFNRLPNAAHYNFFLNVKAAISAAPQNVIDALGSNVPAFDKLFAEESDSTCWVRKSILTPEIAAADRDMDAALTALRTMVRSMMSYPKILIADTAVHVHTMLMSYGNANADPYEEQSGKVRSILSQVSAGGAYHDDISVLKSEAAIVENMIADLQNTFDTFTRLLVQRDKKRLQKPKRPSSEVRRDIEAVYRKIAVIINAGAVLGASPAFGEFINSLNPEIKRLNAESHRVRSRLTPAHTTIEPIPMQPYTGRPVTPLPRVFFQTGGETLELELGKDFALTYRYNNRAGMARLTVHGKEKYVGRLNTTFYITPH